MSFQSLMSQQPEEGNTLLFGLAVVTGLGIFGVLLQNPDGDKVSSDNFRDQFPSMLASTTF